MTMGTNRFSLALTHREPQTKMYGMTGEKNRISVSFYDLYSQIVDYKDSLEWKQLSFAAKVRTMLIELLEQKSKASK